MSLRLTSALFFVLGLSASQATMAALPQDAGLDAQINTPKSLQKHGWYEVKGSGVVHVLKAFNDSGKQVSRKGELTLDNTTDFSVLDINEKKGTALIDLGEGEEGSTEPNIYSVSLNDLKALNTQAIDYEKITADELSNDDEFVATEVARRGGGGSRRRRGGGRITHCARDVRLHLRIPLRVERAADVYSEYQGIGFRPIGKDWENAPVNSVCGFSGGHHGLGHVAVKLPNGMWKGAGIRHYPYPNKNWQRNYRFQGCIKR